MPPGRSITGRNAGAFFYWRQRPAGEDSSLILAAFVGKAQPQELKAILFHYYGVSPFSECDVSLSREFTMRGRAFAPYTVGYLDPLCMNEQRWYRYFGRIIIWLSSPEELLSVCTTPFGAHQLVGHGSATRSDANVASAHASNQPAGINDAFLSSGTPVYHRSFACSLVTIR